jgi:hypothetical protein
MPTSDDLGRLRTRLQHAHIRERRQAIAEAKALLAAGPRDRAFILNLLAAVARDDIAPSIRQEAQAVLDAESKAPAPYPAAEAQHFFSVQCPHCRHVHYFDKRRVCGAAGVVKRSVRRDGVALDELILTCEQCRRTFTHAVDCEGYKT